MTLTRVTNNASCNWVNSVQVRSVQFSSAAVNTAYGIPRLAAVDILNLICKAAAMRSIVTNTVYHRFIVR